MDITAHYPTMKPHIGSKYVVGGKKSIVLIGESHYLPEGSKHLTAKEWYSGNASKLSPTEKDWISTSALITRWINGETSRAYSIYANAFKVINENGPNHAEFRSVADDVVFYNFFQRPAKNGESLVVCDQDIAVADTLFRKIYDKQRPALVVFLSMLARNCANCESIDRNKVIATPHPGSRWWNRRAKKYGNKKGQDLLADAVKALWFR